MKDQNKFNSDHHISQWVKAWFVAFGLFALAAILALLLEGFR